MSSNDPMTIQQGEQIIRLLEQIAKRLEDVIVGEFSVDVSVKGPVEVEGYVGCNGGNPR